MTEEIESSLTNKAEHTERQVLTIKDMEDSY